MAMLSGWGNFPRVETKLLHARSATSVQHFLQHEASLIARGNGRSYGDASLNAAATLAMRRLDHILAFDDTTGLLTCEAGVLLSDILEIFVPRGWFMPVTPGTKFVTIGGMIAADVHGKNHHIAGGFGAHVTELKLLKADGEVLVCSRTQNAEIFAATCGGMGLTGVILEASFMLKRIETTTMAQQTIRTQNLAETMAVFEKNQHATYSVAWIDCLARGPSLGRSVVYLGEHAARAALPNDMSPLKMLRKKTRLIPFYLPRFLLNGFTVRAFNALYYARAKNGARLVDLESFFYPLDAVHHWNRAYGKRGFVQYQCVLPEATSAAGLTEILTRISAAGVGSFLAVLKLLGDGGRYLSFPMKGYTLALDFPVSARVFALLDQLDEIVIAHGGRIYLAKDARMGKASFEAGYPEREAFLALRRTLDPTHKFSSLQAQRLGLV